ncbi:helix-turn-helix domain-containing protein [Pseudomonas amygdali]|uniref:helix-turn-helix domain-containing protein n=1 Tax=Pseudomonas amygdali TaxID=47877 RepID=UPI000EFED93B|nr:helix-turn-helix transcriptional regulator [Pseudomonas amygdali]QXW42868.1 helix-turn-helix domain-containing protein [Pseudomonas amygdali]
MDNEDNFQENLKILCEQVGTVSEMCRRIGINRQQFNKYLAGTHLPSKANLRAIASFFGVSIDALNSNPNDFRSMVEGSYFHIFRNLIQAPKMLMFINELVHRGESIHTEFVGVYERYQHSSIYKGKIVRSIYCIYEQNDMLMHYYIERFPNQDGSGKIDYHFRYHGLTFLIANRIFSIDFETIQKNELTFSNLAPVSRNANRYVFGVTSGIAATMVRQPVATKVAMNYVSKGLITKAHIKRATVLRPDDPSVPKEVADYLGSGTATIDPL